MQHNTFEDFFKECLGMAYTEQQRKAMKLCKSLYEDYYEDGKTPEQAMMEEWG